MKPIRQRDATGNSNTEMHADTEMLARATAGMPHTAPLWPHGQGDVPEAWTHLRIYNHPERGRTGDATVGSLHRDEHRWKPRVRFRTPSFHAQTPLVRETRESSTCATDNRRRQPPPKGTPVDRRERRTGTLDEDFEEILGRPGRAGRRQTDSGTELLSLRLPHES